MRGLGTVISGAAFGAALGVWNHFEETGRGSDRHDSGRLPPPL
jgi:hypothetical protein